MLEISNNYYAVAMDDYDTLGLYKHTKKYNRIAVDSQQIIEKLLKHLILHYCIENEQANKLLLKHKVKTMGAILNDELKLSFNLPELAMIEDYYFDARYPGDNFVKVTQSEAELCLKTLNDVMNTVVDFLTKQKVCFYCNTPLTEHGCPNRNCELHGLAEPRELELK